MSQLPSLNLNKSMNHISSYKETNASGHGASFHTTNLDSSRKRRHKQSAELGEKGKASKPPHTSRMKSGTSKDRIPQQPNTARPAGTGSVRRHHKTDSSATAPIPQPPSTGRATTRPKKVVKQPMTVAEAMAKYGDKLTAFEQSEILEYQHIYFVGNTKNKIQGIPHAPNNNGYDDDRGDYKLVVGDHLEYRYEVLKMLGRGSFGQVVKAIDHKKNTVVALKLIRNKKRFHHQALVEVKILEHLMSQDKEHKSGIVRVYGYLYFRNHLCITFEPLSINLYEFIKNNHFKGVSLGLIRRFAVQLLTSLQFLARQRIVHCDMKPENILLKAPTKSAIRLIDFGSSCFEDERMYTYIQSRFYRSPEVILGLSYGIEIDIWSFGCILAELFTGYPLFPGENEAEQMACMMEVLGLPPKKMIMAAPRASTFFESETKPLLIPNSRGKIRHPGAKDLVSATRCNDPNFISFLKRCLRWDPKNRITPDKAMEHPWIQEALRDKEHKDESARDRKRSNARVEVLTPEDEGGTDSGVRSTKKRSERSTTNAANDPSSKALFPPIKASKD